MLKIISIIALAGGLTINAYAETEIPTTQLMTAQTDVTTTADETVEVEYIEWTFE